MRDANFIMDIGVGWVERFLRQNGRIAVLHARFTARPEDERHGWRECNPTLVHDVPANQTPLSCRNIPAYRR